MKQFLEISKVFWNKWTIGSVRPAFANVAEVMYYTGVEYILLFYSYIDPYGMILVFFLEESNKNVYVHGMESAHKGKAMHNSRKSVTGSPAEGGNGQTALLGTITSVTLILSPYGKGL